MENTPARKIQQAFRRMQSRLEENKGIKDLAIVGLAGDQVLNVRCAGDWTVARLKRHMAAALKIPVKEVHLTFGLRKLRDVDDLSEVLSDEAPVVTYTRMEFRALENNAASTIARIWKGRS
mmetsp:Transcript_13088/g.24726  ORF Transcript_13088/g.24726 Transcript_13088/m.24726 type:complete len:121 (+) Transcript_13088:52-414(+)